METVVRRVQSHEWNQVRDLRVEALRDPDAATAFLESIDDAEQRDDAFWQQRAADAAAGDAAAQFVAVHSNRWVGTATGLGRAAGSVDHLDRTVTSARVDVVGVYVHPGHRGAGIIDRLLDAIAEWARDSGYRALTLDVHVDNVRAQAAYRRCGFIDTGARFMGPIGPELELERPLSTRTVVSDTESGRTGPARD